MPKSNVNNVKIVKLKSYKEDNLDIATRLLVDGFFVRGAVVKGRLYHDSSMVFGEAQVQAFKLESTVVRYPRIMVTRSVLRDIQQLQKSDEDNDYADIVRQAS